MGWNCEVTGGVRSGEWKVTEMEDIFSVALQRRRTATCIEDWRSSSRGTEEEREGYINCVDFALFCVLAYQQQLLLVLSLRLPASGLGYWERGLPYCKYNWGRVHRACRWDMEEKEEESVITGSDIKSKFHILWYSGPWKIITLSLFVAIYIFCA